LREFVTFNKVPARLIKDLPIWFWIRESHSSILLAGYIAINNVWNNNIFSEIRGLFFLIIWIPLLIFILIPFMYLVGMPTLALHYKLRTVFITDNSATYSIILGNKHSINHFTILTKIFT